MTSKILLAASSKRSTKDLLFDDPLFRIHHIHKGLSCCHQLSMATWRTWWKDISVIIIGKAISRHKIKYSQAWAICNCSWSFAFSSWSFDFSSSRLLICRFMSQSRWCFRFASYSLFRAARDSFSHLAIRALCSSKVFRLSTVLYKAWDFKKDRLATSCNTQGKIGQISSTTRQRQAAAEEGLPWYT